MNEAAPIHSFDQCDMSGLLEDLKFRKNIQDASKSSKKPSTSGRPSPDRKKGSPRLSIRKVGIRLRDSLQHKSNIYPSSRSWESLSTEVLDDEFDDMALNFQQPSEMSVSKREETPKKETSAKLSWRSDSEII
jgi:hypothetical protein